MEYFSNPVIIISFIIIVSIIGVFIISLFISLIVFLVIYLLKTFGIRFKNIDYIE